MTPSPFPALTSWRRRARAAVALVVALPVAAVLVAAPASAHDELVETSPVAGSTVTASPAAITLRFDAAVLDISSLVRVTDAAGAVVLETPGVIDGTLVTAAVPTTLPNGTYSVAWRVVAGDGHPVQDSFDFVVAAPTSTEPADTASPTVSPDATTSSATSSATPSATSSPMPSAAASADGSGPGGWASSPLRLVVGGLVLLVAAALAVVRYRRRAAA